jgi:hypothetical protein
MTTGHERQVIHGLGVARGKIGIEDRAIPDANA